MGVTKEEENEARQKNATLSGNTLAISTKSRNVRMANWKRFFSIVHESFSRRCAFCLSVACKAWICFFYFALPSNSVSGFCTREQHSHRSVPPGQQYFSR